MNKAKLPAAKINFQIRHLASFSCLYFQTKYQGRYFTAKEKEATMIQAFNNLLSIMPTIKKNLSGKRTTEVIQICCQRFREHQITKWAKGLTIEKLILLKH